MLVMVSNATGIEVGLLAGKYPGRIGHLFSPGGERGPWLEVPHALDNARFVTWSKQKPWSEPRWRRMLNWSLLSGIPPLWALVPDVPANRDETLREWDKYAPEMKAMGFRLAFAVQDGMTFDDVPDSDCVLFLGGGDEWKDAAIDPWCRRFPKRVHVARVNYWNRLVASWRAGAISVDGTGWFRKGRNIGSSQYNDLRKFLRETNEGDVCRPLPPSQSDSRSTLPIVFRDSHPTTSANDSTVTLTRLSLSVVATSTTADS